MKGGKQWVKQVGKPADVVATSADNPTLETLKSSEQFEMGVVQPGGITQIEVVEVIEHNEGNGKHSKSIQLSVDSDIAGKRILKVDGAICPIESSEGI